MNIYWMLNGNTFGAVQADNLKKFNGYWYSLSSLRYSLKKKGHTVKKLPSEKLHLVTWHNQGVSL